RTRCDSANRTHPRIVQQSWIAAAQVRARQRLCRLWSQFHETGEIESTVDEDCRFEFGPALGRRERGQYRGRKITAGRIAAHRQSRSVTAVAFRILGRPMRRENAIIES